MNDDGDVWLPLVDREPENDSHNYYQRSHKSADEIRREEVEKAREALKRCHDRAIAREKQQTGSE